MKDIGFGLTIFGPGRYITINFSPFSWAWGQIKPSGRLSRIIGFGPITIFVEVR